MATDSECLISDVEKTTSTLKPFFHNRVSEFHEIIAMMEKYCPFEDLQHVSRDLNPKDLDTRGATKAGDIGLNSFCQQGPAFLGLRRELWPVSRTFLDKHSQTGEVVPADEVRTKKTVVISLMRSSVQKEIFPDLWHAVERVLDYSNSILKVKNILARMIRC